MKTETLRSRDARCVDDWWVARVVVKKDRIVNASQTCQKHLRPSWEGFIMENDSIFDMRSTKHDIGNVQIRPLDGFSISYSISIFILYRFYCIYFPHDLFFFFVIVIPSFFLPSTYTHRETYRRTFWLLEGRSTTYDIIIIITRSITKTNV